VPKYLLTELPLLSTLKQGTIDAFALSSPTSDVAVRDLGAAYLRSLLTSTYACLRRDHLAVSGRDLAGQTPSSPRVVPGEVRRQSRETD